MLSIYSEESYGFQIVILKLKFVLHPVVFFKDNILISSTQYNRV